MIGVYIYIYTVYICIYIGLYISFYIIFLSLRYVLDVAFSAFDLYVRVLDVLKGHCCRHLWPQKGLL